MNDNSNFNVGNFVKLVLLVLLGVLVGVFATLKIQTFQGPKQTVAITGTGQVEATTDQSTITAQVKNTATTQELSQAANKKDVGTLIESLLKLGIPQSRITQSSFIQPYYMNTAQPDSIDSSLGVMMKIRPTPINNNGLTTTTNITVILDPIKDIEKVLAAFSDNPNTQVTNTYYSVKNMKNWETKAKEAALKDARSQVESIAKINGLSVGKLVKISDQNSPDLPSPIEPMMLNNRIQGQGASQPVMDKATTVENNNTYYSEQTVNVSATYYVTYELNSKFW